MQALLHNATAALSVTHARIKVYRRREINSVVYIKMADYRALVSMGTL